MSLFPKMPLKEKWFQSDYQSGRRGAKNHQLYQNVPMHQHVQCRSRHNHGQYCHSARRKNNSFILLPNLASTKKRKDGQTCAMEREGWNGWKGPSGKGRGSSRIQDGWSGGVDQVLPDQTNPMIVKAEKSNWKSFDGRPPPLTP